MAIELITKNVWAEITKAVKTSKVKSMVAVAYFGQNAAAMLPLKKGSILLVDASEKSVKCGHTCPAELLKLYYKGVQIYSLENLHAKIYLVDKNMFIGSANVSGNSARVLKEAIIKTNDKRSLEDAKEFIILHCRIEMGDEELKRLEKIYNPPKNGGPRSTLKKTNPKGTQPKFIVVKLEAHTWTKEENAQFQMGLKDAKKKRINKTRHKLNEFLYQII